MPANRGFVSCYRVIIVATIFIMLKPYTSTDQTCGKFKPYMSIFHTLFEDALSHSILGNLTGELRIMEVDKSILQASCKLAFTCHESVEKIGMDILFMPFVFYEGPVPIPIPPPPIERISLLNGEQTILAEGTFNVSTFKDPMVVFGFGNGHVTTGEGEEYNCNSTPKFMFWAGFIDWKLTELDGKTDRSSYTIFLVNPHSGSYAV